MGVSVSETKPDTSTAAVMTTANSWRSRPMTPPMNSTGMKTAASERVIDRMVNPISLAPISAASRQLLTEARQEGADRVDDLDAVRAGLALDCEDHGALVVVPAGDLVGLHAVDHAPELLEPHRRAVAVRHDQRPEGLGILQLAGRH